MVMVSYSMSPSQWWFQLAWLHVFLVLLAASVSSFEVAVSYNDHCSSIIPESTPISSGITTFRLPQLGSIFYLGPDRILNQNLSRPFSPYSRLISFHIWKAHETKTKGVFKLTGRLHLSLQTIASYPHLEGFWSESSGKLCMVGLGSVLLKQGYSVRLAGVLKLKNVKNSSTITDLITGTLEGLNLINDSPNPDPISFLAFPRENYKYTLISEETDTGSTGGPNAAELITSVCPILTEGGSLEVDYARECNSENNCTPFGGGGIRYLPRFVSIKGIHCSEYEQRSQVLVKFHSDEYYQPFNPNTTLVGEGWWDAKKNQLSVVACRVLMTDNSLADAHVGDCSIRLSLRSNAIWSIRNRSALVGQIWSNKTKNESGYFDRITFQSSMNDMMVVREFNYEYTEIDQAKSLCQKKNSAGKKGVAYPNGYSSDMQFSMSVKNSEGVVGWGSSSPLFVGHKLYKPYHYAVPRSMNSKSSPPFSGSIPENRVSEANSSNNSPLNISYKISYMQQPGKDLGVNVSSFNSSSRLYERVEISAEGIYDVKTGSLCMVGCIRLSLKMSMDCEVVVNLQFPPLNSKNGLIKGTIESRRQKSDDLYFKPLGLSSTSYTVDEARQSIWRMDLEIIMALISNTLSSVLLGFQLFYVKNRPNVLPSISLVMLVILTLGYMIPLVLNFEAMFLQSATQQRVLLGNGGWLKVNEVIVRVVNLVVFLMQIRLLQLAFLARIGDESQKSFWIAEKNSLYVSLLSHTVGCLIALLLSRKYGVLKTSYVHTVWQNLRASAGLTMDGFLFPQILLNIFISSRDKALSNWFYIGTTFLRLLPHAYDLVTAHNYDKGFKGSYIYANPVADFYSTAWEVVVPLVALLFSAIIFLQQRFGGRCILPKRFKDVEVYEKVPVVSSE